MRIVFKVFVLTFLIAQVVPIRVAFGAEYEIGVHKDDWAEYRVTYNWTAQPEDWPEPQYVKDMKNIEWNKVVITKISGFTVTTTVTTHWKNGTERDSIFVGNVVTGSGNLSFQIIAAGLSGGDKIVDDPKASTINQTMLRSFAGANRWVNYVRFEVGSFYVGGNYSVYDYYWDKGTGFLTELGVVDRVEFQSYSVTSYMTVTMTSTNLWESGSGGVDPSLAIVMFGVVIVLVVVLLYWKKPRKRKRVKRRSKNVEYGRISRYVSSFEMISITFHISEE